MRGARIFAAVLAAIWLSPCVACAHLVSTRFGDFYGGMLHPLTALEHVLPMVALGLLAGLQDPRVARWLLLAAPAGLACGLALALVAPNLTVIPVLNRGSFVLLGVLVALGVRLPTAALVTIAGVFGLTHGYENGLSLGESIQMHLFALGVVAVGFVGWALITATTISLVRRAGWMRIAVRAAGSWVAAIGLMVLAV